MLAFFYLLPLYKYHTCSSLVCTLKFVIYQYFKFNFLPFFFTLSIFSMVMTLEVVDREKEINNKEVENEKYKNGVTHLCDSGISKVPSKYILPVSDRPENGNKASDLNLKLPVIDLQQLLTPKRDEVLRKLKRACEEYGFFQVVNHGIDTEQAARMVDVGKRFFEQPFEQRQKYMSSDIRTPVRCGTSVNQLNDGVFYWRDFLKLTCHPLDDILQYWPTTPGDFREEATSYAQKTKSVFLHIMGAIAETLGLKNDIVEDFNDGTHMMVVNCYPACPEPNLTLGMPPHSDYGFLTLLLQDEVHGLQVQCNNKWVTVEPVPGSFVVNVGDHLEIFSNGRYKSVLHRVLVNPAKTRISVASLHSLPFDCMIKPAPELVNNENPKLYKDTDFASFLNYLSSRETKQKNFLESRKINAEH